MAYDATPQGCYAAFSHIPYANNSTFGSMRTAPTTTADLKPDPNASSDSSVLAHVCPHANSIAVHDSRCIRKQDGSDHTCALGPVFTTGPRTAIVGRLVVNHEPQLPTDTCYAIYAHAAIITCSTESIVPEWSGARMALSFIALL